jgi:uncharacterized protein involved in type VI secretion and phage assembly
MADIDLIGLLQGRVGAVRSDLEATASTFPGVTTGVVTNIDDPQRLGRVKVRLPLIADRVETAWARIASPWAGQRRGSYLLPEVDDEVLVAFRHGDLAHPYVVGALWNADDPPPEGSPTRHRRELRSRKGHLVLFDDGDGTEQLSLHSQGGLEVTLDDSAGRIRISGGKQSATLAIAIDTNANTISITAESGNVTLSAAKGEVAIAGSTVRIEASGGLTLSGQPVSINPPVPAGPPISAGVA